MPSQVTNSREFRPFRWIGYALLACLVSFVLGMGTEQHNTHKLPPCASTPARTR
ncbi:hypothetical protein [Kutzneria sp. CA-103260]|uniref:hypothetical protein n=1 Tax=Kutzneria sp. CA-103260 TaxID=2802641 RepID=UPI001BA72B4D|nr:hypothetical protein [Kutzneria sp. CA-103260]QUQ72547.1 hypothetical protein JJ691_103360 [Kutzneria sp. CA-103260]